MKLQEYVFSPEIRKDTSLVDFVNSVTTIINQGLASVVIKLSYTSQTAAIGTTTMLIPTITGEFRISAYMICTTAGGGTLSFALGWTDEVSGKTLAPISNVDLSSTANGSTGIAFIHAVTGAITFSTSIAGISGSPKYSLFLILEQLG